MIKNLLVNWKTSAAGVGLIVTSVVALGAALATHTSTQILWSTSIMGIFAGLAALAAGDATASAKAHEETKQLVGDLQNQINAVKSDTTTIPKQ